MNKINYFKLKSPIFVNELQNKLSPTTNYAEFFSVLKSVENREVLSKNGYFVELVLRGVGFRVFLNGRDLLFQVGFSHFFIGKLPHNNDLLVKAKRDRLVLFGYDKALVSLWASYLVSLKYPDSYKAKGIQIKSKEYRIKEGKKK